MTEHIMETASAPETAKTEEKKNGITEGKKKIPHSHPHYSTEWKELETGKESDFATEITLTGIFRLIYNSNPFYLISAAIILYAQSVLFGTSDIALPTLIPVGLIASYTLLLAATAVFIVQWGHVWDDARSILLIILLLLMILSVSTDSQMLDGLTTGLKWSGGGLFFSVLVLESLRRILKIRIAPRFLAAAYSMLALFFLYPVLNARLIAMYPDDRLPGALAILFFPVAAAAVLLGFLPYLYQKSIPESGTPWKTPYFPWSIAGLLGAGALFRIYLLTISFDPARGIGGFHALESGFMLWMWVPILLAGMILAMEYAMLHRRNTLSRLCLPLLFLATMITPEQMNAPQAYFCSVLQVKPWSIGLFAALAFYLYAWFRRVPCGEYGASLILAILAFAGYPVSPCWTGGAAVLILLQSAIRRNATHTWCIFTVLAGGIAARCLPAVNPIIPAGAVFLLLLTVTTIRDDKTARILRMILLWGIVALSALFLAVLLVNGTVPAVKGCAIAAASLSGLIVTFIRPCKPAKAARSILFGLWALFFCNRLYVHAAKIKEFRILLWAVFFFLAAVGVSLHKGFKYKKRNI